jgi:hypothetical protein
MKMYLKWFPDLDCDGLGIRPGGPGDNQPTDVGQEKIARCDVFREHSLAGCGMLVAGGLCYRRLMDNGGSLVSRKVHRLLRVPPTGSSASGDF